MGTVSWSPLKHRAVCCEFAMPCGVPGEWRLTPDGWWLQRITQALSEPESHMLAWELGGSPSCYHLSTLFSLLPMCLFHPRRKWRCPISYILEKVGHRHCLKQADKQSRLTHHLKYDYIYRSPKNEQKEEEEKEEKRGKSGLRLQKGNAFLFVCSWEFL